MTISADIFGVAGVIPGVLKWQTITANQTAVVNNGYIVISPGGAVSLALPSASNVGDQFAVVLAGATSWSITQGAGQQIRINNQQTTSGTGGSLNSTNQGNLVVLLCDTANTHWTVIDFVGSITVV